MRQIGVRELKQSLSETLHAAGRGEHIRVTLRGRPIVDLVPVGAPAGEERLRALVAAGRVAPPATAHPPEAPPLAEGRRSASNLVLSERDIER